MSSTTPPEVLGVPAVDPDVGGVEARVEDEALRAFLLLELGGLRYALPAHAVQEVVEAQDTVPVPQVPAFVRGVFPLAGRVIVLIELRALLGLPPPTGEPAGPGRTLVVSSDAGPMGLRVDAVLGLQEVPGARLRVAHGEPDAPVLETFLEGPHVVSVLDVQRLVALAESRVGRG